MRKGRASALVSLLTYILHNQWFGASDPRLYAGQNEGPLNVAILSQVINLTVVSL